MSTEAAQRSHAINYLRLAVAWLVIETKASEFGFGFDEDLERARKTEDEAYENAIDVLGEDEAASLVHATRALCTAAVSPH